MALLCSGPSSSPSAGDRAEIPVPADQGRNLCLGLGLALEPGPQTRAWGESGARARGRGGQGALTSESQAGDWVAAPVLLLAREIAGPRQQAAQHGSGARGAQRRAGGTGAAALNPDTHRRGAVAFAAPQWRGLNAWERPQGGHRTLAGRTLPTAGERGGAGVRRAPVGVPARVRNDSATDAGSTAPLGSVDTAHAGLARGSPQRPGSPPTQGPGPGKPGWPAGKPRALGKGDVGEGGRTGRPGFRDKNVSAGNCNSARALKERVE